MNITRRTALLGGLSLGCVGPAAADNYPSRHIRVVVGPGLDTSARVFGGRISELLRTQVVVEPRPGAGGAIAAATLANSAPDGYTLLLATAVYTINRATGQAQFDLRSDCVPICHVTNVKYVLVLHPSVPANDLAQLIAFAKANPGKLNYASTGIGTPPHLAGEMFKNCADVDIVHIPFRDPNSSINALIGGNVQMMFALAQTAQPQIEAGLLKGIGLSTVEPSPFVPQIQSIAKLGLTNFADVLGWNGFVAPKGTPDAIVSKLNQAICNGLEDPAIRKAVLAAGYEPTAPNSPSDFAAFIAADTKKWIDLAKAIGMTKQ